MNRGPEKIGRFLGAMVILGLCLLLSSCSTYRLSTLNHDSMYPVDYVIPVAEGTKIDTIDSYFQLRHKLRTDFSFRWDFAQYAMQQPYSWYWNNPRLEGIWRPYNRFDVYFYSNYFWNDWAFHYPFHHTWGWDNWYNWNRPYNYYGWNRPYNPWNSIYNNSVWNLNRRGNISYINGYRTSRLSTNSNRTVNTNRRTNYNNRVKPNNNDQTIRLNTRTTRSTQSSGNGWRRRSREIVPTQPIRVRQPNTVQPGQIRGGSRPSVPQQTRTSSSTSQQRRSSSIRRRN